MLRGVLIDRFPSVRLLKLRAKGVDLRGVDSSSSMSDRRPGESAHRMAESAHQSSLLNRLGRISADERAWWRGARGEELVAKRLARIDDTWSVFHDIQIDARGRNVDHLVIGPGGVFCLNAKNLTGRVWVGGNTFLVNGSRTNYVEAARREAAIVSTRIRRASGKRELIVRPVIVVIADQLTVRSEPRDVSVVGRRQIASWLSHQAHCLELDEIALLARAADAPSTWAW
jgi:hypothetical protein